MMEKQKDTLELPNSFWITVWQSRWNLIIFAVIGCIFVGATWFISGYHSEKNIAEVVNREQKIARSIAETMGANIVQRFAQIRSVPIVMAGDQSVLSILRRFGPNVAPATLPMEELKDLWLADVELGGMTRRLNEIRSEINIHTIFLVNASGDCVAAGKPSEIPFFIGANYTMRQYFIGARNGQNSRQFAVGLVDSVPSIFYSTPVFDEGRFLGAIVARINITQITNLLLDRGIFVADENGVIILAQDKDLLWKALPGARISEISIKERENIYKRKDFETVDLVPIGNNTSADIMRWENSPWPYVMGHYTAKDGIVAVHVLRDLKEIETIRQDRVRWFFLVSLTGLLTLSLVLVGVSYYRGTSRYRRKLMHLNESLAYQARTDGLTGCANRRAFLEALEVERQREKRYVAPFSMLSLDIDHFKRVNDVHGHPGGDQVLRHFVCIIEKNLRSTDLLGRMGGEEFNILLPETGGQEAILIAERIRTEVENSPAIYEQEAILFTVSIGVVQWRADDDETVDDFLARSDKMLYGAKDGGRNQVKYD